MVSATEQFASVPWYDATLSVTVYGDEAEVVLTARRKQGKVASSGNRTDPWEIRAQASGWSGKEIEGEWRYAFTGTPPQSRTVRRYRFVDLPAGDVTFTASVTVDFPDSIGKRTSTPSVTVRIGGVPKKMAKPVIDQIERTDARLTWVAPNANYSAITGYDIWYNTAPSGVGATVLSALPEARHVPLTKLAPDSVVYARVRAKNKLGVGEWSDWVNARTRTALGPVVTVASDGTGYEADVTIAPGSTTGSIDYYVLEIAYVGPPRANAPATRRVQIPASGIGRITGLIPSATFRYRAYARLAGGSTGPWSDTIDATQQSPSFPRGVFFAGDTAPRNEGDLRFRWAGTQQLSTSEGIAPTPVGWQPFPANALGARGVVFSLKDAFVGARSVRAQFHQAPNGRGIRFLSEPFPVDAEGSYWGSLHVRSSRSKLQHAVLVWLNGSTILGTSVAEEDTQTASGSTWYRLAVRGEKPALATHVAIGVEESLLDAPENPRWGISDTVDMDAAAVFFDRDYPYFDGSMPNAGEGYAYFWEGTPHATRSYREDAPLDESLILVDPDCVPIPPPPRPPSVRLDCIDDAGQWNRYTARVSPTYGRWVESVPTVWIEALLAAESQVRVRWFRIEGYYRPVYGEWVDAWRNLFVNPSMTAGEGSSAPLSLNLVPSPYPTVGSGWRTQDGFDGEVDETVLSPNAGRPTFRVQRPVGSTHPALDRLAIVLNVGAKEGSPEDPLQDSSLPVEVGKQYTLAAEVMTPYATPLIRFSIRRLTVDGGGIWQELAVEPLDAAGEWTRIIFTTPPIPAGTVVLSLDVEVVTADGSPAPEAVPVYVGEAMMQEGLTIEGYFDGSSPSEPGSDDFYVWASQVGSSTSERRAEAPYAVTALTPAGAPGATSAVWASKEWAIDPSGQSVRVRPLAADPRTAAVLGGASTTAMNAGMVAGGTYTALATFHQAAPQVGTLDEGHARRIRVVYNTVAGHAGETVVLSEQAPNEAGTAELRLEFTLPANAVWAQVQLGNGAAAGGGDVFYDNAAIVDGTYDGVWFSGDTFTGDDVGLQLTSWEGEPNRSVSLMQARTVSDQWYEPTVSEMDPTSFLAEQVISYLPLGGRMALDGVDRHAWFEKNNGVTLPADHLLAGSSGRPPSWPVLSCTEAYYLTIDVPATSPDNNLAITQATTAVVSA